MLIVLASAARRGAETEGYALAGALSAAGQFEAEVVALVPAADDSPPLPVDVLGSASRSGSTLLALRGRARQADVVLAFGSTTLPACSIALAGNRTRFVYRSIGDPRYWVRGALHRSRTGLLMRRSVHVIALWDGARASLIDLYGLDPARVSVIPNARPADRFAVPDPSERRGARHTFGVLGATRVIVYVGALAAEKRVDHVIKAVAAIPGAVLLVAGEGRERAALEGLAERVAPGRVRFLGPIPDPVPVLHAADALVLASRTEGMPGVVIEALLCGVPVVAPDVGAVAEMLADGVTGHVSCGDVGTTTAGLQQVTSGRFPRGAALRAAAVSRYSLHTVAAQWARLLREVAG